MNRIDAEKAYKKALSAWNKASLGNCEKTFDAADAVLTKARQALVKSEINQPAYKETKKQNEVLQLRNRGLDI